jgi:hypothetical protein
VKSRFSGGGQAYGCFLELNAHTRELTLERADEVPSLGKLRDFSEFFEIHEKKRHAPGSKLA